MSRSGGRVCPGLFVLSHRGTGDLLFALAVADGELRAYLFAGMLMGFAAYRRTVGRAVVRTAYRLLRLLHRASRRLRDAVRRAAARLPRPHLPKRLLKKRKKVKKGLATEDEAIV